MGMFKRVKGFRYRENTTAARGGTEEKMRRIVGFGGKPKFNPPRTEP